jgi:hypothetical protein
MVPWVQVRFPMLAKAIANECKANFIRGLIKSTPHSFVLVALTSSYIFLSLMILRVSRSSRLHFPITAN